ncbi:something about silencing, SAS, complex subunit 4-domain-containing protein [Delphinella strobiligena]|nr:something about silencing, SAS, complex subunit 4-domain-containing protein [Delphinella strobiligena]
MHEKAQLEKLLEGLQGHDWLRMMGITGVTDSEAKKYESKRDYFVSEVKALLMKFKMWKEEERRLKLEKEAAAAAEEEAEEEVDEAEETEDDDDGHASSSDFDGAAARQLQMEASGAPQPPAPPPVPTVLRPPTPEGPFVSFYSKPHLRAAALGKARHGRNLTAFGQPLPEPDEVEFVLPGDYMTPEAIKESARRRRRMKRESLVDSSVKK